MKERKKGRKGIISSLTGVPIVRPSGAEGREKRSRRNCFGQFVRERKSVPLFAGSTTPQKALSANVEKWK